MLHVAKVLLFNDAGRLLLQLRSKHSKHGASQWGLVGGKLDTGETPEQALVREVREETGYALQHYRKLAEREDEIHHHWYIAPISADREQLTLGEGEELRFVSYSDALRLPLTGSTREILMHAFSGSSPIRAPTGSAAPQQRFSMMSALANHPRGDGGTMTEAVQRESFAQDDTKSMLLQLYNTTVLPITVEKPWGHETIYACTDRYVGKILHVKKGHVLSLQYHERKQESNMLLRGKLLLIKGPNALDEPESLESIEPRLVKIEIDAGFTWTNMPGDVHTIQALEDTDVLEVSTPELGDVVRLKDGYGRTGTSNP